MESSRASVCPSCAAPAQERQRWCLECGAELPQTRRFALRPAVGIATTLAVLVGAASAGGYTLLRNGAEPPPPARTVAQATSPATTTPALPPATQEPLPAVPTVPPTPLSTPSSSSSSSANTGGAGLSSSSSSTTSSRTGGGATPTTTTPTTTTPKPQLALSDIALGAAAVVYAPYAADNADLGDASRVVDGTTRTAWSTPTFADPSVRPQIGVYVDLASRETIRTLVIHTPTPGMGVEIYGASSGPPNAITDPGWDHVATRATLAPTTKIGLPAHPYRYVLVWVTGLPPNSAAAAISELSLLSLQPE